MNTTNRKGMVPRLSNRSGFAMRVPNFLDGTLRTYFAPGQDWRTVLDYQKPTDWPKDHALRVPQVVWITVFHYVPTPRHTAMVSVARAVKSKIEGQRQGRTFISVLDVDSGTIPPRSDCTQFRYSDPDRPPNTSYDNEFFLWVEPPAVGLPQSPPFFATDFLSILIGMLPSALVNPAPPIHWPAPPNFYPLLHPDQFAFDDQPYFLARRADYLAGSAWLKDHFTRLGYRHYGYTDTEDSRPYIPNTAPGDVNGMDYNYLTGLQVEQPSAMPQAAELMGLDCQYLGSDTGLAEPTISAMIAAHYGFTLS